MEEKLDKHFFEVLNPAALPEDYSAALKKNDRKTAMKAAIRYFRHRPTPASLKDLSNSPVVKSIFSTTRPVPAEFTTRSGNGS